MIVKIAIAHEQIHDFDMCKSEISLVKATSIGDIHIVCDYNSPTTELNKTLLQSLDENTRIL
jgi:hypothetical protein